MCRLRILYFQVSHFLEGTFEHVGLLLLLYCGTFFWRVLPLNFYKNCENRLIFSPQHLDGQNTESDIFKEITNF